MAKSNRGYWLLSLISLLLFSSCVQQVLPATAEDQAAERSRAALDIRQAHWVAPQWYRATIGINVYSPPHQVKIRLHRSSVKAEVKHRFIYWGTWIAVAFCVFSAAIWQKILGLSENFIPPAMLIGGVFVLISGVAGDAIAAAINPDLKMPWHFSVFIASLIVIIFPLLYFVVLRGLGLTAVITAGLADANAHAKVRANAARERAELASRERANRLEIEKKERQRQAIQAVGRQANKGISLNERMQTLELAAHQFFSTSSDKSKECEDELFYAISELTGYEHDIKSSKTHRKNLKNIIDILNKMKYNKDSLIYKKMKSLQQ